MKQARKIGWSLITLLLLVGTAVSQSSQQMPSDWRAKYTGDGDSIDSNSKMDNSAGTQEIMHIHYLPLLGGGGMVPVDQNRKTNFVYGGVFGYSWDSNLGSSTAGVSASSLNFSPFVGISTSTPRTNYLLRYDANISQYPSGVMANNYFQRGTAAITSSLNQRWSWNATVGGGYGQGTAQATAIFPDSSAATASAANQAFYLLEGGTITLLDTSFGLHYQQSERNTLSFTLSDTYNSVSNSDMQSSVANFRVSLDRLLSPRSNMELYGQTLHDWGSTSCTSSGFGVGFTFQVQEQTTVEIGGGPQFSAAGCGTGANYTLHGAIARKLSKNSTIRFDAARAYSALALSAGGWSQFYSGKYTRQLTSKSDAGVEYGYTSSDLASGGSYHGSYLATDYGRWISNSFKSSVSFRRFTGSYQPIGLQRNVILFTLAWYPTSGHIFR